MPDYRPPTRRLEAVDDPRRFRIYYGNGSTYVGDPYHAPGTDVQVVAVEEPGSARGFVLVLSKDAYYYKGGRFWGCDHMGMLDYLMEHEGPQKVIFGRTVARNEDYWVIVNQAKREGFSG